MTPSERSTQTTNILREILSIQSKGSAISAEDSARLAILDNQLNQLRATSVVSYPTSGADSTTDVMNKKTLDSIPNASPTSGVSIQYVSADKVSLVEYINLTQSLNPWKRERQCDIDFKSLMVTIDKELSVSKSALDSAKAILNKIIS